MAPGADLAELEPCTATSRFASAEAANAVRASPREHASTGSAAMNARQNGPRICCITTPEGKLTRSIRIRARGALLLSLCFEVHMDVMDGIDSNMNSGAALRGHL
jgi:hypothetical protein